MNSAFKLAPCGTALALALADQELCDVLNEHDKCDKLDVTVLKLAFEMLSSGFVSQDLSNLEASTPS